MLAYPGASPTLGEMLRTEIIKAAPIRTTKVGRTSSLVRFGSVSKEHLPLETVHKSKRSLQVGDFCTLAKDVG